LGWEPAADVKSHVQKNFRALSTEEASVMQVLEKEGNPSVDLICFHTGLPVSRLSGILLDLELAGFIRALPGNCYCYSR